MYIQLNIDITKNVQPSNNKQILHRKCLLLYLMFNVFRKIYFSCEGINNVMIKGFTKISFKV